MKFTFIQFHAEPLELIKIGLKLADEFDLYCICVEEKTKKIISFDNKTIEKNYTLSFENGFLLCLLEEKPTEEIDSTSDLIKIKEACVYIEVGPLTEKGLKESIIAFSKEKIGYKRIDPKKVISKFKKYTKTGAIAFNPDSGEQHISRTHRYTDGAKNLYDSGINILPFAGSCFFKLPS